MPFRLGFIVYDLRGQESKLTLKRRIERMLY
jgi:hypothetical protein